MRSKWTKRGTWPIMIAGLISLMLPAAVRAADSWFDDYGSITWEEERAHLDSFSHYLAANSEMNGYLIFFAGSRESKSKLEKRISRARDYLIRERKVDKTRLLVIRAGKRSTPRTILQPIDRNLPPPIFDERLIRSAP